MKYSGINYRSVWADYDKKQILIIEQTKLPFEFNIKQLSNIEQVIEAVLNLEVRGAPAIGIAAAFSMWLSFVLNNADKTKIENDYKKLVESRPTAVNLRRGADFVYSEIMDKQLTEREIFEVAQKFADMEVNACYTIGLNGFELIEQFYAKKQSQINILTHCNAGWLACGDFGTALSPIFEAHKRGVPLHVWVDETRPLNQGSRITAWELANENIPFDIISDNSGGLLMMTEQVDIVIVGADRIVANGDVANKIGTYLKALAAKEHNVPFYVAAPITTFDFNLKTGSDIAIEKRKGNELQTISGLYDEKFVEIKLFPDNFSSQNHAFDITPAKFVTGYITEKGFFGQIEEIKKK